MPVSYKSTSTRELLRVHLPHASHDADALREIRAELSAREHVLNKKEGQHKRRANALQHRKNKHRQDDRAVFSDMRVFRENVVCLTFHTKYTTVRVFAKQERDTLVWSAVEGTNIYALRNGILTFLPFDDFLASLQSTEALKAVAKELLKKRHTYNSCGEYRLDAEQLLEALADSAQELEVFRAAGIDWNMSSTQAPDKENAYANQGTWCGLAALRKVVRTQVLWFAWSTDVLSRSLASYATNEPTLTSALKKLSLLLADTLTRIQPRRQELSPDLQKQLDMLAENLQSTELAIVKLTAKSGAFES
jgi:hypothetical protein